MSEVMENEVTTTEVSVLEPEETSLEVIDTQTEDECGSGKALGLVLAGIAGVTAVGTVVYKKLKAKKDDKPKKKTRKRLRWVEEPIEDEEYADDVDETEEADFTEEEE